MAIKSPDISPSIQMMMGREGIILGKNSVGSHFRNEMEVADVLSVVEENKSERFGGLAGARVEGRRTFAQKELFEAILRVNGESALGLTSAHRQGYLFRYGVIPESAEKSLADLTEFLAEQEPLVERLTDIDLASPKNPVRGLAEIDRVTAADLFPAIEVVFWQQPDRNGINEFPAKRFSGALSRTIIQVNRFYPVNAYDYNRDDVMAAESGGFRPFRMP